MNLRSYTSSEEFTSINMGETLLKDFESAVDKT